MVLIKDEGEINSDGGEKLQKSEEQKKETPIQTPTRKMSKSFEQSNEVNTMKNILS